VWLASGSSSYGFLHSIKIKSAFVFLEDNDVGIEAEPNDSSSPTIPADAVNGLDQVAKRQCPLLVIGFHAIRIWRETCVCHGVFTLGCLTDVKYDLDKTVCLAKIAQEADRFGS
jgi:hypothetical protein